MNILFACTTLDPESSFVKNFDYITNILSQYNISFPFQSTFVIHSQPQSSHHERKDLVHRYQLIYSKVLSHLNQVQSSTYDAIVLTQCNNFVDLFTYPTNFYQMQKEIELLYDALKPNGYLFNFFYSPSSATNFSALIPWKDFHAFANIYQFPTFLFLVITFELLFLQVQPGVYQKRPNLDLDQVFEMSYWRTFDIISKLYDGSFIGPSFSATKFLQLINAFYLDNSYISPLSVNQKVMEKSITDFLLWLS
jgi:hypothetical protein